MFLPLMRTVISLEQLATVSERVIQIDLLRLAQNLFNKRSPEM